jgi:hypothetical protein
VARYQLATEGVGVYQDTNGNVVADVPFVLTGGPLYAASSGGTAQAVLTTDSKGRARGWLDPDGEPGEYGISYNGGDVMTFQVGDAALSARIAACAQIEATVLETTDTSEPRALEVYTTNPFARHERFVVENNQSTEEVDINFRNCTVNFGDPEEDVSMAASAIFMQPAGGTQSPIQVCKAGGGPLGHKVFQVAAAGAIQLAVGGLSSVAIRVNAEGEANDRWWLGELGEMRWGPGAGTALDTDLKRRQAGIMEVGQIGAVGRLQVGFVSSVGYVQSRDEGTATFKALHLVGSTIDLAPNDTTKLQADATGIGFFGTTPIAKPTGVAVTAAGVHAALVSLGLIAA